MNKRKACKINDFKYPNSDKISSRISTLRRSMASTLLLREPCTPEEEIAWMKYFPDKKCAYCGKDASHLDHLYPLIDGKYPSGYGTDPANLVPCCKDCNQLKGSLHWRDYMTSDSCKHVGSEDDIKKRIEILDSFDKNMSRNKAVITAEIRDKWEYLENKLQIAVTETEKELEELKKEIYIH